MQVESICYDVNSVSVSLYITKYIAYLIISLLTIHIKQYNTVVLLSLHNALQLCYCLCLSASGHRNISVCFDYNVI